jgi:hypothetical protein
MSKSVKGRSKEEKEKRTLHSSGSLSEGEFSVKAGMFNSSKRFP